MLILEWDIPRAAAPGKRWMAGIEITTAFRRTQLRLRFDPVLPVLENHLRFKLSLNTYGPPHRDRAIDLEFHRVAHRHRATLAPVPYGQSGSVYPDMAPELEFDEAGNLLSASFDRFVARYGALFDGSAFADLPRAGFPVDHWYLPLHESWPLPIEEHYAYEGSVEDHAFGAPPIESAFDERYKNAWKAALIACRDDIRERDWIHTSFQTYFNNKVDFKIKGQGSSWWLLDEPAYRDDFLALEFFAEMHHEVILPWARRHFPFRIDLSRPQFRRNHLDGLVDICVNNAARYYPNQSLRPVRTSTETIWSYGQAPHPASPPWECIGWLMEAYDHGCQGLVPWQCVGTPENWIEPSPLALILPPREGFSDAPAPTLRLKALRQGLEDLRILASMSSREREEFGTVYGTTGRLAQEADPYAARQSTSLEAVMALRLQGK